MVMKDFWNQRYSEDEWVYGKSPNAFFKEQLDGIPPGKIILPAEGEGRNAVYAAGLGWDVTALDYSEAAREKALRLANKAGLSIDYKVVDLSVARLPSSTYDAAAFIFVHLPRSVIQEAYRAVIDSLKPGAGIILEVYAEKQLGRSSGGPKDIRVLYTEEKVRKLLEGTQIEYLEECETVLDEGPYHQGKAMVIRAVAYKS